MVGQEECLPPAIRHPGCECACDQEAQSQVQVQRVQVHMKGMRDRSEPSRREDPGKKRPISDRHVHLAVGLVRRTENPALRLALGRINHPLAQCHFEENPQDYRHQESARELGGDELPTQKDE